MSETRRARICIPVCASSATELIAAVERAAQIGDLVELRLDYLPAEELPNFQNQLPFLLTAFKQPIIITLRPAEQGGQREIDNLQRAIFWTQLFSAAQLTKAHADLELDLALFFQERESEGLPALDWLRVICSHHDFAGVPADLEKIYERMIKTPARILKIAVRADEITDCLPVLQLLERAQREGREMIAVAMGEAGLTTRILGPSRGAYLTYGSLDDENRTAPGQIRATQLRDLYRIDRLDRQAMITGLVGSPVSHSLSPQMHNAALKALDLNAVYIPFEVKDCDSFARRMVHPLTRELNWNLRGLSVTAPHKSAMMKQLDFIEPSAKEIGAVNTVVVEGGELHGYNTDVTAFISTLGARVGALRGLRCAILGAGGAARAVLWGLRGEGARARVFARHEERGRMLAQQFEADSAPLAEASFDGFDVVINTTPLGTRGRLENETPATSKQLRGARFAYDLVYNPAETRFMREARQAGCDATGGLQMLVAQAAEQFQLWTGTQAPIELMREAAQTALYKSQM